MENRPNVVLIVDDEIEVQTLFKFYFKKEVKAGELTLYYFASAKECIDYLINHGGEVDLILSDINMPQMDGFELLRVLKKDYPKIKILIISAYDSDGYRTRSLELGALHFFEKPLNFTRLKEVISKELKKG